MMIALAHTQLSHTTRRGGEERGGEEGRGVGQNFLSSCDIFLVKAILVKTEFKTLFLS
jgi:hypothetical protein